MRPIFSLKPHKRIKRIVGTEVPAVFSRVQVGASETSWDWCSKGHRGLAMRWLDDSNVQRNGGVWVDSLGVERGSTHYFTTGTNGLAAGSTNVSINISNIPGDIYIKGIAPGSATGDWTADIDGVPLTTLGPTVAEVQDGTAIGTDFPSIFWIANGSSNSFDLGPETLRNVPTTTNPTGNDLTGTAIICKNPNLGSTLNLSWTIPLPGARTVTANLVKGTLINELTMGPNTGSAPNIYDFEPTDMAALLAWGNAGNSSGVSNFGDSLPGNDGGTFGVDPDNGMKYARFRIPKDYRTGISWFKEISPGVNEMWTQISVYMEESVWNNIHPNDACKFAGGPSELTPWAGPYEWHMRMHHGGKSWNNPHLFSYEDYFGSDDVSTTTSTLTGTVVRAMRWYVYEVHMKMNSFTAGVPNSDGFCRFYVNKNFIGELTNRRWRGVQFEATNGHETNIICHWIDFFMGGNDYFAPNDMWYRIGRIRASTQEMSIPPELVPVSAQPDWRVNIGSTVNTPVRLTGTAFMPPANYYVGVSHWSAPCITDLDEIFVGASGGHNASSNQVNGNNAVYKADWRTDGPSAVTTLHAGTSDANAPDWGGGTLGGFYATKPYRAHYPADLGDVGIRPQSQNYTLNVYVPGNFCNDGKRRVFYLGLNAPRSSIGGPNSRRQVDAFRIDDNMWDAGIGDDEVYPYAGLNQAWGDIPPAAGKTLSSEQESAIPHACFDYATGLCYWAANTDIFIFNPSLSSNHWSYGTTVNGNPGIYTHAGSGWNGVLEQGAMLIDSQRNRLVFVEQVGLDGARLAWFPKAGGAIQFTTISGITIGQRADFINDNPGFTYDSDLDKYILVLSSAQNTSSIDYWYEIEPDNGQATLLYESASGEGCHNRAMGVTYSSFLKGCIYVQGGLVNLQQAARNAVFFPRQVVS